MIAFQRTTRTASRPAFVVDPGSIDRDNGRQIDWDLLDSRYSHDPVSIVVTADADIDDTTLAVEALTRAIQAGEVLDFGLRPSITVTIGDSGEAIGQTDITVDPLPGKLRAGAIIKSGAGEFMQLTADADVDDVSVTAEALEVALEGNDTLVWPAQRILARVTVDAEIGDESITVEALDVWINTDDVASLGSGSPGKQVKAGTVMDLLSSGKVVPSALGTGGGVTAYGILETNADEMSASDADSGYGMICGGFHYENLLPEAAGSPAVIDSNWKTELRARGGAFRFEQYLDDSGS